MDEFDLFLKKCDEYGILMTGKKVVNRLIIQHLKHINTLSFSCPNGHSTFNFVYQASKKAIMCICFSGSDLHLQYSDFEQDIHFFYTVCEFLVNTPLIYQNKVRLKKC